MTESEQRIINQFGGFCTKVLKNEANRIRKEHAKQFSETTSLEGLSKQEIEKVSIHDEYFREDYIMEVQGIPIVVSDNLLVEALNELSEKNREVILLYYFLNKTDREIGEFFHIARQVARRRRLRSLHKMRQYLESEG